MIPSPLQEQQITVLCDRAKLLSPDQKKLVQLAARGLRAKNIAHILMISEDAVKQRKRRIENQIGVGNFNTVIAICTQAGFALTAVR